MKLAEPIVFEPLFMERVWGGRQLETLYRKPLPNGTRIGESWEVVDREEAQSVVHCGPLKGKTLHELWTDFREPVFGKHTISSARFPLLFKLLDAQERLSVQVHPPQEIAGQLGGEPKTEMWYIAHTQLDSDIFAGLRKGIDKEKFERALNEGTVEECIHRLEVKEGDAIFIPSGRVHAIGAGNVIVEVQQNSDTTYRVFDWNRVGLDGRARELHVQQSLKSIDFQDVEPELQKTDGEKVVECEYFLVERWQLSDPREGCEPGSFAIFVCLTGEVECGGYHFEAGDFFLMPAEMEKRDLAAVKNNTVVLRTTIPDFSGCN